MPFLNPKGAGKGPPASTQEAELVQLKDRVLRMMEAMREDQEEGSDEDRSESTHDGPTSWVEAEHQPPLRVRHYTPGPVPPRQDS
jgi:hypothetical protein